MKNLVFVVHDGQIGNQSYLFEVPEGIALLKGDRVICDTRYGERYAECIVDSATLPDSAVSFIVESCGATLPLRKVVGRIIVERLDTDRSGIESDGESIT